MEVYIQMIGWHKLAIPSSLRLFVNGEFTLINCGENNQRFLNEHKMHIARIKNICFTKISPETIGGLIGLLLTIDNISDNSISIYGPKPIERIINNFTSSFAKIKNLKITIHEFSDNNIFPIILKGNVIITPILLNKKNVITTNHKTDTIQNCEQTVLDKRKKMNEVSNTHDNELNNVYKNKNGEIGKNLSPKETNSNYLKKRKLNVPEIEHEEAYESKTEIVNDNSDNGKNEKYKEGLDRDSNKIDNINNNITNSTGIEKNSSMKQCIFYLIECPQTIGKFHVEKAQKLNIPPGKYYGMLKSGKSVTSFYFLGTGCSIPSAFRNVSGIILNIQKDFSVILDFGEGSLYQLYWISKSWIQFTESIKSIKVIFISHAHADHHVGIYYFLYIRKMIFPNLDPPLILIPKTLKSWMNLFNELFLDIEMRIIYNENDLEIKEIISEDNFLTLHLFKVNHIKESYGIKIESKDIGSIVYSADTRPCDNVKRFAKDCNILIHEATFDDELLVEAINKKHSTIHEAMQISLDVNCKTLILTHFSQRYPKAPILNKSSSAEINEIMNKTIYSFDYMCIPLNLTKELPTCFNILLNLLEKLF